MDIRDWIAFHAARRPAKTAQIDHATGRTFTYQQMNDRVARIAGFLRHTAGLSVGDVVGVIAQNSSRVFDIDFACGRAGAIFLPVNVRLAAPEIAFQLDDAKPKLLFVGLDMMGLVTEAVKLAACDPEIIPFDGDGDTVTLEGISTTGPHFGPLDARQPDDGWTLIYSSGTTGRPKGVLHTHGGVAMQAVTNSVPLGLSPRSCGLTILPLFHISGLNVFAHAMFYAGATQITMERFDPAAMLAALANPDYGVTHFSAVPTIFEMLTQVPGFQEADLTSVEGAFVGGASSTLTLLETYAAKGMPLIQGYGLTETGPTLTVLNADEAVDRIGSAGKPLMHVDLKLVDPEGACVPAGDVGEILARGPSVITSYFNRPDAQGSSFLDGWLRTGDMGRFDAEGFLYIVDRKKDMFISGGENVYPAEVENVIASLTGVLQVAVVGVPDDKWGEVGAACLVADPAAGLTEDDIISFCDQKLARYKIPRHVRFFDALPLGGTGKVLKAELKNRLGEDL